MRAAVRLVVGFLLVVLFLPMSSRGLALSMLEVETTSGSVLGVAGPSTLEWRGIPYAAAPVEELRWKPPSPVEPWAGTRDANEFGPPCIQLMSETETLGSEDCLYLNVFAPSTGDRSDLPVMVHLHGGSNMGLWPYENASAFTAHGVIVVTLAYRLGAFGFIGHPALTAESGVSSGEYGVLDQLAALEWVQANIEGFGGNPNNVTLFGESAGSFDALALVASPLAEGLFQRAALQTAFFEALYGSDTTTISHTERVGQEVWSGFGCADADDEVECLRSIPAQDLVVALGFGDFIPWVGGQLLSASPRDLIAAQPNTIPLLLGSNREEATHWFYQAFTGEEYKRKDYMWDSADIVAPDAAEDVRRHYPIADYPRTLDAGIAIFSDALYTCPMRALADTSSGPVWRYLYTHTYDNDPFLEGLGAAHFLDDPIMWLDPELLAGFGQADYQFSEDEIALSGSMTGYWTNFAKTGNPNDNTLANWPAHTSAAQQVIVLEEPITVATEWHAAQCDFFDSAPLFMKPGWFHSGRIPAEVPYPGSR